MRNIIKIFLALLLFSIPFSIPITGAFAATSSPQLVNYTWGSIGTPIYATPGMINVPFTVQFNSTSNISYGELTLTSTPITSSTGSEYAYAAPTGGGYLTFYLNIPTNATPGSYSASLLVILSGSGSTSRTLDLVINAPVSINVSAPSSILAAGGSTSFPVEITNRGNSSIYGLSVTPASPYVQLVSGNTSSLGYLTPNETATFTYDIYAPNGLALGLYPVSIDVTYSMNTGQAPTNVVYYTYLAVTSVQGVSASLTPSILYYQRNNSMVLTLTNNADHALNDVIVNLDTGASLYIKQGAGPFNLSAIPAGGSSSITLNIIPTSAQATATVPITVEASYKVGNITQFSSFDYNVLLTGDIVVSLSNVAISGAAYNGTTLTISGSLLNSGTEEAYYGTLYVNGQIAQAAPSTYIGDLPTDSPTPFSASFTIPSDAISGTYTLTLVYVYQDSLGNTYNITYPLHLSVISGIQPVQRTPQKLNYALYTLIAILVVLVLVIVYLIRRRRSRSKQELTL